MEEINVLYTTDHNYLNYMLSSMYSLLENNKNNKINIHIVYDKFEKEDFTLIENVIKKFNNSNLFLHSFENIKNEIEKYNIPNWRDTKIANARLFFSKEIKGLIFWSKQKSTDSISLIVKSFVLLFGLSLL